MPLHNRKDKRGNYFQWGSLKKYYYYTPNGRILAKAKAMRQAKAIWYRRTH